MVLVAQVVLANRQEWRWVGAVEEEQLVVDQHNSESASTSSQGHVRNRASVQVSLGALIRLDTQVDRRSFKE